VCGASLPTTIVFYSVYVTVLKIEYFFLIRKQTRDRSRTRY
jgi:preprotein translocase subunit YajC